MCSPYLTGSLAVMLVLITFNYWSVSSQNSDLMKEVQHMTKQIKISSERISALERSLRTCEDTGKKYQDEIGVRRDEMLRSEKEVKKLKDEKKATEDKLEENNVKVAETGQEISRLREENQVLDGDKDRLQDDLEASQAKVTQLEGKGSEELATCLSELASERSDRLLVPPGGAKVAPLHLPPRDPNLGPGHLPDVRPEAVSVVRKETRGGGNSLLILPPDEVKYPGNNPANTSSKAPPVMAVPNPAKGISSSSSTAPKVDKQSIDGEVGVLALPPAMVNLDKAEDDSQIVENVNGPEGKKDLADDDQSPDGEVDETVDVEKQQYLVDKAAETGDSNVVKDSVVELVSKENVNNSENEENLDNLKKSLNRSEDEDKL